MMKKACGDKGRAKTGGAVACCGVCNVAASSVCQTCREIVYCSRECQRKDWPTHKGVCSRIKERTQKTMEDVHEDVRSGQRHMNDKVRTQHIIDAILKCSETKCPTEKLAKIQQQDVRLATGALVRDLEAAGASVLPYLEAGCVTALVRILEVKKDEPGLRSITATNTPAFIFNALTRLLAPQPAHPEHLKTVASSLLGEVVGSVAPCTNDWGSQLSSFYAVKFLAQAVFAVCAIDGDAHFGIAERWARIQATERIPVLRAYTLALVKHGIVEALLVALKAVHVPEIDGFSEERTREIRDLYVASVLCVVVKYVPDRREMLRHAKALIPSLLWMLRPMAYDWVILGKAPAL